MTLPTSRLMSKAFEASFWPAGVLVERHDLLQLLGREADGVDTGDLVEQLVVLALVGLEDLADRCVDLVGNVGVVLRQELAGLCRSLGEDRLEDLCLVGEIDIFARQRQLVGRDFLRRRRGGDERQRQRERGGSGQLAKARQVQIDHGVLQPPFGDAGRHASIVSTPPGPAT